MLRQEDRELKASLGYIVIKKKTEKNSISPKDWTLGEGLERPLPVDPLSLASMPGT